MRRAFFTAAAFFLAALITPRVHADVGLILNESLDTSIARITSAGHSAVYLSRICPGTPVKLCLCAPSEHGSVISNYRTLGEDQPFEWNIVPLGVYLYGVPNSDDRPLFASEKTKNLLEEEYREKVLTPYCAGAFCAISKNAEWREMVSATSSRSLYIFVVKTTVQQDLDLIAKFNSAPNINHFNGFTRNCADFTLGIINAYFPGAAHRDYLNDFGIASPKAIARSFSRYAHKHPESEYRVLHFAQLPGTIKRSSETRDGTEQLFHSKKLLFPLALVAAHELPVFIASYTLTGRFNPQHEFAQHPTVQATQIDYKLKLAKADDDDDLVAQLKSAKNQEHADVLGSSEQWRLYREAFDSLTAEAIRAEIIPDRESLNRFYKALNEAGTPFIDSQGRLWMDVSERGEPRKLGLTSSSVLAKESDPHLAFELLLANVNEVFKSPAHSRETMPAFEDTWALLQQARARLALPPSLAMQP